MCGIAGYFGAGNKDVLKKMTRELRHRGPNDEGLFTDGNVGLGHRRLSIIDLSLAGHQPMSNEDNNIVIVCNGEIYNFKELKKDLKKKHLFKSSTDIEIIIHLYEEAGEEVFKKIQGMFAIALYDKIKKKIILARDRMGKKPLYYGIFNNTLIFGSELKALLKHAAARKELDLKSLNKYLLYDYVPTPHSIFKNIFKLEPGHYLIYDGNKTVKKIFWDITFNKLPNYKLQHPLIIEELDKKINRAVEARLISDVPLGVFLSGGIDSSTIAYYAQKNSKQKIKTYSIGFKEDTFDESDYARLVAKHLKTDHYEKRLRAKDSLELVPKIANLLDEPFADPSIVPTYLLCEFARERVTVALGGDGGDELFCGYDTFIAHRLADIYEKIPLFIRKSAVEKIALKLPVSFNNLSFDFKAKKFIAGFYGEKKYRYQRWLGSFDRKLKANLFTEDIWHELKKENEFEDIDNYLANLNERNDYNQLIYLYLKTYMMDEMLVKVDRASMFNALEVRTPFLDTAVVDFVNSLPINLKLHKFTTKYILKELMKDKLPREIIYRKKKGFGIPVARWLSSDLKYLTLELLNRDKIENQGLFNFQCVNKLLSEHFARRADNRKYIWNLLIFQIWQEKWL